tara:strand:+ start:92 stop:280 length:189 start_codon:yes stop_codon:yes gene_type:complete
LIIEGDGGGGEGGGDGGGGEGVGDGGGGEGVGGGDGGGGGEKGVWTVKRITRVANINITVTK